MLLCAFMHFHLYSQPREGKILKLNCQLLQNTTKVKLKFFIFRRRPLSLTQGKADLSNEQYTQVSACNVVGYVYK